MKEDVDAERYASDVAFTASVKAAQARKGSRHAYAADGERGLLADADHA